MTKYKVKNRQYGVLTSFTSKHGEDESSFLDPSNPSSDHFEEEEGENSCFKSSPLYDSSYQEDAFILNVELSDHGFFYLFIISSSHNSNFSTIDLSKPSIFNDLPFYVLGLLQVV